MSVDPLTVAPIRPAWRGRIHRWAAFIVVPCFVALTVAAEPVGDRVASAVYGLAVFTMLAVSATYHAASTPPVWKQRLRPVDHSTIFLAIAGSYTGIATLALQPSDARPLIIIVWAGAAAGIVVRVTWRRAPMAILALVYLVVGWSALIELPALLDGVGTLAGLLVVAGGLVYTAGAIVFATHKPDPVPAVFGFHEVFHALVVAGVALHFAAAVLLV